MTLILKLDLDMIKMYLHTNNKASMSSSSKVIAWTDRNTDRHTDTQTHRHDRKHYLPTYGGGNNYLWTDKIEVYYKMTSAFEMHWVQWSALMKAFLLLLWCKVTLPKALQEINIKTIQVTQYDVCDIDVFLLSDTCSFELLWYCKGWNRKWAKWN